MIKDRKIWEEFEKELIRGRKPDYDKNKKIFKELRGYAILMKAIPSANKLENIETKKKFSKVILKIF